MYATKKDTLTLVEKVSLSTGILLREFYEDLSNTRNVVQLDTEP